jgi:hypothetical protein
MISPRMSAQLAMYNDRAVAIYRFVVRVADVFVVVVERELLRE